MSPVADAFHRAMDQALETAAYQDAQFYLMQYGAEPTEEQVAAARDCILREIGEK